MVSFPWVHEKFSWCSGEGQMMCHENTVQQQYIKGMLLSKILSHGTTIIVPSPVQELGMHVFNALNWPGQHAGFEFLEKNVRIKRRQNPNTVVPLLHLVFAHHMKPVNKLGGFGPVCTVQRPSPKVI